MVLRLRRRVVGGGSGSTGGRDTHNSSGAGAADAGRARAQGHGRLRQVTQVAHLGFDLLHGAKWAIRFGRVDGCVCEMAAIIRHHRVRVSHWPPLREPGARGRVPIRASHVTAHDTRERAWIARAHRPRRQSFSAHSANYSANAANSTANSSTTNSSPSTSSP